MRSLNGARALVLLAVVTSAACHVSARREAPVDPENVVRIAPTETDGDDDEKRVIDPAKMKANLEKRFPGLSAIDFARVLIQPEERAGRCWTEVSPPWETAIAVDYSIDGKRRSVSGIQALKEQGWWPIYRAPQGQGFERRADFDAIDLTVGTSFACRCAAREGVETSAPAPLELRFRWAKGKMPEVSAAVSGGGKKAGLTPSITYGHLLTYDFEARGAFPTETAGRCGARVILSILADPPIV